MDEYQFFKDLGEIVVDPLFIRDREDDIDKKTTNNTCSNSVSNDLVTLLNVRCDDWKREDNTGEDPSATN